MNYRKMGRTGLKLSEIGIGAWVTFGSQITEKTASDILHAAYDLGINFFDNADIYAEGMAETIMGKAIRDLPRESLVISSKVFWPTMEGPNGRGLSRKHIMESCHASLRRLNVEYVDLYFCHRYDPETPLEEVVRAMDDLVHQGKVLYWGTSEWRAAQIVNAHRIARQLGSYPPMVEQPHYNLFVRQIVEGELIATSQDLGFGLVTWSPLRSGLLTGKYNQGIPTGSRLSLEGYEWLAEIRTEEAVERVRKLAPMAQELGVSMAQLAIGWLLRLPQITSVITGATRVDQLEENVESIHVPELLTDEVLDRIEAIMGTRPVFGS